MKHGLWIPDLLLMGKASGASSPYDDDHPCRVDQMLRVGAPRKFGLIVEHLNVRAAGSLSLNLLTQPDLYIPGINSPLITTPITGAAPLTPANRTRDRIDIVDGILWLSVNGGTPTKIDGVALQTYLSFLVTYNDTTTSDWSYFFRIWYYIDA